MQDAAEGWRTLRPPPPPQQAGPESILPLSLLGPPQHMDSLHHLPPTQMLLPPTMNPVQGCFAPPPSGDPAPMPQRPQEDQEDTLEDLCRPLYCKLCSVTLNSARQAHAHYQGKNHGKKLRSFYSRQPASVRIPEVPEGLAQSCGSEDSAPCRQATPRIIPATENDYCKLCDASFSSLAVAQAHYNGKNHAKKLRLAEVQQSAMENVADAAGRTKRRDERRRRTLQLSVPGPYCNPRQRIPRDLAMCVTPSGQFYCSMCNSGAEQENEFRQHLESKQHKAKVSELRYRHEMENLGYS